MQRGMQEMATKEAEEEITDENRRERLALMRKMRGKEWKERKSSPKQT